MEENKDLIPEQPEQQPQQAEQVVQEQEGEQPAPATEQDTASEPVWQFGEQVQGGAHTKGRRTFFVVFGVVVGICLLLLVGLMFLGDGGIDIFKHIYNERTVYVREDDGTSGMLTPHEAADAVRRSTVTVYAQTEGGTKIGSGFVYDDKGHICTNHHVISGVDSVQVMLYDGTVLDATVVGSDKASDLAVLRVDATGLIPARLGSSAELLVGDDVVAVGTPVEVALAGTATFGKVSYTNRLLPITDTVGNVTSRILVIQTDVSVNHGNSGGPLADMWGNVVGIVARKMESSVYTYEGLGFAIPIDGARVVLDEIIEKGEFTGDNPVARGRLQLGLSGHAVRGGCWYLLNESTGQYMEFDEEVSGAHYAPRDGVFVIQVTAEGAKGKILAEDIIMKIDGLKLGTTQELISAVNLRQAGEKVILTLLRGGEVIEVEIRLSEVPLT